MHIGPSTPALTDVSRPFKGEARLSAAANLDASLVDGQADQYQPSPVHAQNFVKGSRSSLWVGGVIGGAAAVAFGVVSSLSLGAFPILLAAGAAVGAAVKWVAHDRHEQGSVEVRNDGQATTAPFHGDPTQYPKSAADVRLIKTCQGEIGDQITQAAPPPLPAGDPAKLAAVDVHRETLMDLGKQRRLLGDFGNQSQYGHQVLNMIDAPTARKLIASGQPVFLLQGKNVEDVRHTYQADSKSKDGQVKAAEAHELVERKFSYDLIPVASPDDLKDVPAAVGLPAGMPGVYKNTDLTPQIVYTNSQTRLARLDGKFTTRDQQNSGVALDPQVNRAQVLANPKVPLTHGDVNAGVAFAVAGGILGVGIAALTHMPGGVALLPAAAFGAFGYNTFDKFMRNAQGQPLEG